MTIHSHGLIILTVSKSIPSCQEAKKIFLPDRSLTRFFIPFFVNKSLRRFLFFDMITLIEYERINKL